MKFLRIVAQVVGYGSVALAALMLMLGDTTACFIMLAGGLFVLWMASRLPKSSPSPEEQERIRQQRKADEEAWRAHVQEDIRQQQAAPPPEPPRQAAPSPPPPVYESRRAQQRRVAEERKQQAAQDGVACCPRCGSTSLSINKKGFGGGKATAGMLTFGLGGAVAGTYGMNGMKITCLNCGYKYKPGKRTRV